MESTKHTLDDVKAFVTSLDTRSKELNFEMEQSMQAVHFKGGQKNMVDSFKETMGIILEVVEDEITTRDKKITELEQQLLNILNDSIQKGLDQIAAGETVSGEEAFEKVRTKYTPDLHVADDSEYEEFVKVAVQQGLDDIEAGNTTPHEDVRKHWDEKLVEAMKFDGDESYLDEYEE